MQQNVRGRQLGHHFLGVGDEISEKLTAIGLHSLNDIEFGIEVFASSTVITPSLPDLLHRRVQLRIQT